MHKEPDGGDAGQAIAEASARAPSGLQAVMEWVERCLLWLMDRPKLLIGAGNCLCGLAVVMAGLGARFHKYANKLDRAAERTNTTPPDLLDRMPWPIQMLTPETAGGWVMVVMIAATGLYLVWFGRWARRL